jgi:hypothetical protein
MDNKMTRNDSPLDDLEDNILNLEEEVGTEIQPDEWWVNRISVTVHLF